MPLFKPTPKPVQPDSAIERLKNMVLLDESHQELEKNSMELLNEAIETAEYLSKELENTMYRFFTVIDNMVDIVIIRDPFGKWQTVNRFAQVLLGLHITDYYNKTNDNIHCINDRLDIVKDGKTDQQAWNRRESVRVSMDITDVHGEKRCFDIIKTPVYRKDRPHEPKELIIIGREITAQSPRNGSALSVDALVITDRASRILYCNNSFVNMFGYGTASELEGKNISILKSNQHTDRFYQDIWKTVNKNKTWNGILYNADVNGNILPCQTTIIPIMNDLTGTATHYFQIMKVLNRQ